MKNIILVFIALAGNAFAEAPPNIVFFFTDDQTSSSIGCYGNDVVKTPVIDGLAARGTRFENAFVSHSICWVSRTTILSGLIGRSFGTSSKPDTARPDAVKEVYSDVLRSRGYRTGYFGKWHAKMPKGWKQTDHFDVFEPVGRNPFFKKMPDGSVRHETEVIVDKGIHFIKNQPNGKPFMISMNFNACHAEDGDRRPGPHFAWPKAVNGMYDDVVIAAPRLNDPAIFDAQPDFLRTTINRERYFWRWNTPEKYQTNIRAYYRMVSGIDGAIGRFIEALEEADMADNTIIIYSADNGYHLGNRGFAGKWSHYEESLRVPLIIMDPRTPKAQQGQVTDAIALNLDLPASFIDWAGGDVPNRYQGASLKPIVSKGDTTGWRKESFHEHFAVRSRIPPFEGLRNAQFKYVRYFDHGDKEFLHDLQKDPDELVNLADDPEYASVLVAMRKRTDARVAEVGGPLDPRSGGFTRSTDPYPVAGSANAARPGTDGWHNLLRGNGLRGWDGNPDLWSVKNGILTGKTNGQLKLNRFLTWKATSVHNFELEMNVKISEGANSGIQYRSKMLPEIDLDVVSGYQADIAPDRADINGMMYEERGRRILARTGQKVIIDAKGQAWITKTFPVKTFAPREWHHYRIVARGNHLQHFIDGHPTAEIIDFDEKGRKLGGVLGFQVHKGPPMEVQFKEMRIKHLPDDLPLLSAAEHPIPATATGVKPQGKLPKDWKPPVYGEQ